MEMTSMRQIPNMYFTPASQCQLKCRCRLCGLTSSASHLLNSSCEMLPRTADFSMNLALLVKRHRSKCETSTFFIVNIGHFLVLIRLIHGVS